VRPYLGGYYQDEQGNVWACVDYSGDGASCLCVWVRYGRLDGPKDQAVGARRSGWKTNSGYAQPVAWFDQDGAENPSSVPRGKTPRRLVRVVLHIDPHEPGVVDRLAELAEEPGRTEV
jgi:hypothetical protein